ncbi:type I-G CRISPR-associated protein Csb2 [Almyronema epifaneia]|uniref:Type I-U CRISPR-associated protein Csb2 n=1 Tax=Almyronema epifaneia S1 TaxID=2991925 RepID=A0ABW6ILH7_9CYAN
MGVGISIRFLAGRYHATPWDHQVNEGVVEWPPSPWRILRALVSAYYRLPNPPERVAVNCLMTQLAEELPSYVLPQYTTAHTRHYMPIRKEGKNKTTLVFDTFLVLEGGARSPAEIQVCWPSIELDEPALELLKQLCQQVSYLGRAEAWAEMSVLERLPDEQKISAQPITDTEETLKTRASDRVEVLAPLDAKGLEGFRAALTILPKSKKSKVKWKAPVNVLEALEVNVADLHSQGWNGIPGSCWVPYSLKSNSVVKQQATPLFPTPNFARYALVSNVLPKLTEALSVGDRFHTALTSRSKDEDSLGESVFSGRDEKGQPLVGHQHAFFLPEDADGDGKIDHVIVYAKGRFNSRAVEALARLHKVWNREGLDLRTILVSLGNIEDYYQANIPIISKAKIWKSLTPLVLPRHPKVNRRGEPKFYPETQHQIDGPEDQVCRLLQQLLRHPCKVEVEPLETNTKVSGYYCSQFQLQRQRGGGRKGSKRGYGFRLVFDELQEGPIALGYGSHFGLGLFVADKV